LTDDDSRNIFINTQKNFDHRLYFPPFISLFPNFEKRNSILYIEMEIASPCCELPDPFGQNRNKRSYSCAQFSDSTGVTVPIDHESHVDENVFHSPFYASKKRRMNTNEEFDVKPSPFMNFSPSPSVSTKRPRSESSNWNPTHNQQKLACELQRLVEHQALEIRRLKAEKNSTEETLTKLKPEHEKTLNENRILKRAVAIQQERQQHAANEIVAACRFKTLAEERIRKLEQLNLTLRYRLEALSPSYGNDFMKFSRHPPDVF